MRYIRFLKPPRIVDDDRSPTKKSITCKITITSDLGDSFLADDFWVQIKARDSSSHYNLIKRFQWSSGMRALPISVPVDPTPAYPLVIEVGLDLLKIYNKYASDKYKVLFNTMSPGLVSAFSTPLDPQKGAIVADKLVERRFETRKGSLIKIWEETGESIARHLWDAGVALSYYIDKALNDPKQDLPIANALRPAPGNDGIRVLELGTGCGIVGITLATLVENTYAVLTDLPEAAEFVARNIDQAVLASGSQLYFQTLDWDDESSVTLTSPLDASKRTDIDVIVVADCTYNPDSSPALVKTLQRIAKVSPEVQVIVAMKKRHSSEGVFFELMANGGFVTKEDMRSQIPLPCDDGCAGEHVDVYIFRHQAPKRRATAKGGIEDNDRPLGNKRRRD